MKFMELDIQRFATFSLVVTFNSNTGTGTMSSQIGTSRDDILDTNTFTKEGYIFNGWNTSADGTGISIQEGITLGEVSDLTIDIRGNEDLTLYAQWTEDNSNKYVTFGGLKRYDEKIKDYIAVNSSKIELLSNYVTTVGGSSGSGNTDYSLNLDKILEEEFSGKLYNNVNGTVGYEGNSYYLLNADFIEIICVKTSDNGHLVVIYNGYRNKISINLSSSGDVVGGYYVGLNNFVEAGNPEPFAATNVPVK